MAVFSRVKVWVSNEVLTASDLNGEFNNLLNNTIPASIEDYSPDVATMQSTTDPGGVGTESLATTLAGELQRLRYKVKQILGGDQWYSAPLFSLKNQIATAFIADKAVTRMKLADVSYVEATGAASFSTSSASFVTITGTSVTIVTTGKPLQFFIKQTSSGSASASCFQVTGSSGSASGGLRIQETSAGVTTPYFTLFSAGGASFISSQGTGIISSQGINTGNSQPNSGITAGANFGIAISGGQNAIFSSGQTTVAPYAAGTYTFELQMYSSGGGTSLNFSATNVTLGILELG
jgi:hypothetical protein